MREKREKGYWLKQTERFGNGADARARSARLREVEQVSQGTMQRKGSEYVVSYSVAKWYIAELETAGLKL